MKEPEFIAIVKQRGGQVGQSVGERVGVATSAKARSHTPGSMNKTEKAYSIHLDSLKAGGAISGWYFESVKFRLADKTWYCPDFLVIMADGQITFHEVKCYWRDDARVKFNVAAEMFPIFRWVVVKKTKGGWWMTPLG